MKSLWDNQIYSLFLSYKDGAKERSSSLLEEDCTCGMQSFYYQPTVTCQNHKPTYTEREREAS